MNTNNKVGLPNGYNALAFETVTPQKRQANSTCDHRQPSKIAKMATETEVVPVKNEPLPETNDPTENGTSHDVTIVPGQDCFPLLAMPSEPLLRILGYLSHRDIVAIEKTCLDLRNLAARLLTVRSQAWYAQFETSQQQQFTRIAKNISQHKLKAWLMQFTRDEVLVSRLCSQQAGEATDDLEACNPEKIASFPQRLFYRVAKLMFDFPVFNPALVSDIQCKSFKSNLCLLTPSDVSYLVTNCDSADCCAKIHVLSAKNLDHREISIQRWGCVRAVSLSADKRHMMSSCGYRAVKISSRTATDCWAGQLFVAHEKEIVSAAFSPDSRHAVTASEDMSAYICSVDQTGCWALTARITHEGVVNLAEFSPDSRLLVTASDDHTVKIHEFANGTWLTRTTLNHNGRVFSARFSPDGNHIITVSHHQNGGQTATIYSVNADGRWTKKADITHSKRIWTAFFSPDSKHVVTASSDHTCKIFSCDTGNNWQFKAVIHHTGRVRSARFSPNSLLIITASDDCSAKIYAFDVDHRSWSEQRSITHERPITSTQFSADSCRILTLSGNNSLKHCINHQARIHSRNASGQWLQIGSIVTISGVHSGQFNHDGSHVAICDCSGKALIIGIEADRKELQVKASLHHPYRLGLAEFNANSSHIVTISLDATQFKVWCLYGKDLAPPSPSKLTCLPLPPPCKKSPQAAPQLND
ncbi:F-box/WD repeat-containing protein [Endozoicomonas acroporae]|uniref:F-box/WD repeat-containing protein n=1 Tax=Endozoicomonas acroporae TaxID=1701104 RepID=UPI000C759066|nr:hypothetical protein [Endozoicomonas acroporae]